MELEALEAIWPTEFRPLDPEEPLPPDWPAEPTIYSVDLSPAAEGEDPDDYPFRMQLLFQHTDRYPEEPPRLKVKSVKGLTDADVATVKEKVDGLVEENIGLAMIYTLAEAVKEWLRDKANVPVEEEEEDPEAAKARREEEEEKRLAEMRALGTPVTPENFRRWKEKFDAEQALARAMDPDLLARKAREQRLTGRQYFTQTDPAKQAEDQGELYLDEDDFDDDDDEGMLDEYLGEEGEV